MTQQTLTREELNALIDRVLTERRAGKKVNRKTWACQECGHRCTAKQAERYYYGDGCPKCGGADFDLSIEVQS